MSKEKVKSLKTYLSKLEDRLTSAIPSKHLNRPLSYKRYLENEKRLVSNKIQDLLLTQDVKK